MLFEFFMFEVVVLDSFMVELMFKCNDDMVYRGVIECYMLFWFVGWDFRLIKLGFGFIIWGERYIVNVGVWVGW